MEQNQLASQIAKEYEIMAIEAANQHFRLKRQNPFEEFPALRRHVAFCTLMHDYWKKIAQKLNEGPQIYEREDWEFYE